MCHLWGLSVGESANFWAFHRIPFQAKSNVSQMKMCTLLTTFYMIITCGCFSKMMCLLEIVEIKLKNSTQTRLTDLNGLRFRGCFDKWFKLIKTQLKIRSRVSRWAHQFLATWPKLFFRNSRQPPSKLQNQHFGCALSMTPPWLSNKNDLISFEKQQASWLHLRPIWTQSSWIYSSRWKGPRMGCYRFCTFSYADEIMEN